MVGGLANHEFESIDIISQYLFGVIKEPKTTALILPNISTEIQTWLLSNKRLMSIAISTCSAVVFQAT
jgi:hypothetical protein